MCEKSNGRFGEEVLLIESSANSHGGLYESALCQEFEWSVRKLFRRVYLDFSQVLESAKSCKTRIRIAHRLS